MTTTAIDGAKRRTALVASGFALVMILVAYAAVPLYRAFCAATGFAGTTGRAEAAALPDAAKVRLLGGRTIKVRFDGNVAPGMAWRFAPEATQREVKIGERALAFFRATNLAGEPTTGRALFNVTPDTAGKYFKKIACFCFDNQTLNAGESVDMPVTYFIDPAILDDPDARKIDEITLSYTFYPVDAVTAAEVRAAGTRKE